MRLITFGFLVFFSFQSLADVKPFIDKTKLNFEVKFNKLNKGCKNKKLSLFEYRECSNPIRAKLVNSGMWHGTEEYRNKHFSVLSEEALKARFIKLNLSINQYRITSIPKLGEITNRDIRTDIDFIESELSKRWRLQKKNSYQLQIQLKREVQEQLDKQ